jgi:hypothetical protein
VGINRHERMIGISPMGKGLVAHTLHEERDLNNTGDVFDKLPDPERVKLAVQLIDRLAGQYDAADIEGRYESRLREYIAAKLRGEGIETYDEEEPDRSNVVDLMAALRKSLGQEPQAPGPTAPGPATVPHRRAGRPAIKLPIDGGKKSGRQGADKAPQQRRQGGRPPRATGSIDCLASPQRPRPEPGGAYGWLMPGRSSRLYPPSSLLYRSSL